jgi:hypothetical protein
MPTRHGGRRAFIKKEELKQMTLSEGFSFTKELPVMQIPYGREAGQNIYPTMLFDLEKDPNQESPIEDEAAEKRMIHLMRKRMKENQCPLEMLERYGF